MNRGAGNPGLRRPTNDQPGVLLPPWSVVAASATAWWGANGALFLRAPLSTLAVFRYFLLHVDVSSGNIQYGLARLQGANRLDFTLLMDSGIVPCPSAADQRLDLGGRTVEPGDLALFLWCDNTTAQFRHATGTGPAPARQTAAGTFANGVPKAGTLATGWVNRYVTAIGLEADA